VKHSQPLLQQEQTHYYETAARIHSAAVSSLMSYSSGSSYLAAVEAAARIVLADRLAEIAG
jgi:hypothetical protein